MKIYTKKGDAGETGLFMSGRFAKDAPRLEAIGQVDHLNSALSLIATHLPILDANFQGEKRERIDAIARELAQIQSLLFDVGAVLAQEMDQENPPQWMERYIADLEESIDSMTQELPPLRAFILPGGTQGAAFAHHARSTCRKTERTLVTLQRSEPSLPPQILAYINRLSDYLFTLARYINFVLGIEDILWQAIDKN